MDQHLWALLQSLKKSYAHSQISVTFGPEAEYEPAIEKPASSFGCRTILVLLFQGGTPPASQDASLENHDYATTPFAQARPWPCALSRPRVRFTAAVTGGGHRRCQQRLPKSVVGATKVGRGCVYCRTRQLTPIHQGRITCSSFGNLCERQRAGHGGQLVTCLLHWRTGSLVPDSWCGTRLVIVCLPVCVIYPDFPLNSTWFFLGKLVPVFS